jgi:hypothetical protein
LILLIYHGYFDDLVHLRKDRKKLQIKLMPKSLQWVIAKIINNNFTSYKWERDDALQLREPTKLGETEAREEKELVRDEVR